MTTEQKVLNLMPGIRRGVARILVLALLDAGLVTLECMMEACLYDSRDFEPSGGGLGRNPRGLSFDHIVPVSEGGGDHPTNIRLAHQHCNDVRGGQLSNARGLVSERNRERWQDGEYRARAVAAVAASQLRPEVAAAKSRAMKAHWADPEKRAAHIAAQRRGSQCS